MPRLTLADLAIAYRKAKVDLYHSSDARLLDLAHYEDNLTTNLNALLEKINSQRVAWTADPAYLGTFTLMPKQIKPPEHPSGGLHWSDPRRAWGEALGPNGEGRPEAQFRLMARCSIDMHVLSTAWMMTAGEKLERRIGEDSKGSRLRRTRDGSLNRLAPGSFKYYFAPYSQWRDNGLRAMKTALEGGHAVIVLTADATSFYHRLHPEFLADNNFLSNVLNVTLDPSERKLNRLFVKSLLGWAELVAAETGWRARGLPVGLPASAVVANLALAEFDRIVSHEFKPLYYGRYVDDIILVLRDGNNLRSVADVWNWLIARSNGTLQASGDNGLSVKFSPSYLAASDIEFGDQNKNKVFHLSGPSGEFLLGSIKRTIDEQTSRWRALPTVPSDPTRVGTDIAAVTTRAGESTTTLRDADHISARRAAFAIRLRDFEAFERDLHVGSWSEQRAAFFLSVCEQVLVLPTYFEFAGYLPRLVKLAAACGDVDALCRLLRALSNVYKATVEPEDGDPCHLAVKEFAPARTARGLIAEHWRDQLLREAYESLLAGASRLFSADAVRQIVNAVADIDATWFTHLDPQRLRRQHARLFVRDLAHVPYRFRWLAPDFAPARGVPSNRLTSRVESTVAFPMPEPVTDGLDLLVRQLRRTGRYPSSGDEREPRGSEMAGLLFATRPLSMLELYLLLHGTDESRYGLASPSLIRKILLAIRGYSVAGTLPHLRRQNQRVIDVHADFSRPARRIALSMLSTSPDSWKAAAINRHDLSLSRYEGLMTPLTALINGPHRADYLLLPESSVPATWFVRIAQKLQLRDIDLVAGVEYRPGRRKGTVYSQVWSALRVDRLGFPALTVLRQDKQRPAPEEEPRLFQLSKNRLAPEVPWDEPPIVVHGGFAFSILVCSELTNISYRSSLRGNVDALLVPEWNQDIHSFEALVESSALDVHAYIAQANHRSYGDSRIRAPRTHEWERDIVRLRGGVHDYIVIGEIDYLALRAFQSAHRVPGGPFKPLPDGFKLAAWRRHLPMSPDS